MQGEFFNVSKNQLFVLMLLLLFVTIAIPFNLINPSPSAAAQELTREMTNWDMINYNQCVNSPLDLYYFLEIQKIKKIWKNYVWNLKKNYYQYKQKLLKLKK